MGVAPNPDPCRNGCIFRSFQSSAIFISGDAYWWWELWCQIGRTHTPDKGKTEYYLDYPSFPIVFEIYSITDPQEKKEVFAMMCKVRDLHESSPLTTEQIFGWAGIPDD